MTARQSSIDDHLLSITLSILLCGKQDDNNCVVQSVGVNQDL